MTFLHSKMLIGIFAYVQSSLFKYLNLVEVVKLSNKSYTKT